MFSYENRLKPRMFQHITVVQAVRALLGEHAADEVLAEVRVVRVVESHVHVHNLFLVGERNSLLQYEVEYERSAPLVKLLTVVSAFDPIFGWVAVFGAGKKSEIIFLRMETVV